MDYFLILLIILITLFIYLNYKTYIEHFYINNYLPINNTSYDNHQDIIINNSTHNTDTIGMRKNKILSQRDSNLIPTYALYQPEVSERHLNFFSHAPNTIPYYPNQIWSSTIQDPYYQPVYSNYFYK